MKRRDGKRFKSPDMMYSIAPFIMDKRCDSCNSTTVRLPFTRMNEYISRKRTEGLNLSYMSLIIAAYARTVSQYPALNRFIVNKRIYSRYELVVAMVVQRAEDAQSTFSKLKIDLTDTIYEVNKKIEAFVNKNRSEDANKTDAIMRKLTKFTWLLGPAVGIIKFADRHGMLPRAVLDASPFHASMVISNLASIRTNHIYHHIYDFGTVGQIITIGNTEEVPKIRDGKLLMERQLPLGVVCDERICSGYYYSKCFREMQALLNHPEMLELRPENITTDFAI